jgi:DDE superfamily endonuclease
LFCEPLTGWREVKVTARRTRTDGAEARRELSDVH